MSTHEIQARALQMPLHERAHLAKLLLASLDSLPPESGDDDEIERAWAEEAERRDQEIRSGTAKLIPAEEVFAELRARLEK